MHPRGHGNTALNVRLVNGSSSVGFVQVKKDGEWGILCNINAYSSTLACQELGFQSGVFVRFERYTGMFKHI